jgi:Lon protease-like protein
MKCVTVPLFPLPNVVLFPRAVLPLHIFEERYKVMTADALRGDRRIAMALLRPGWEQSYYAKPAIEPVVCIGQILSHEKLPDGKYNFLLQGCVRGRVVREVGEGPYRMAEVELLRDQAVMEIDLCNERQRLTNLFTETSLGEMPMTRHLLQLLVSPMCTGEVADLLAFSLIEDTALKQSLLGETDVLRRVERVTSTLEALRPVLEAKARRRPRESNAN